MYLVHNANNAKTIAYILFFPFQYHIGQLYMIAKHSAEESGDGEGVEVVANRPHEDPVHGKGQYTEKRMYGSKYVPDGGLGFMKQHCENKGYFFSGDFRAGFGA